MKRIISRFARSGCLVATFSVCAIAQEAGDVAKGEQVFNRTCATGYCHGVKGTAAGAPRLAARGFDQAFIYATVTRGISGTAMAGFANVLDRSDLAAVVAYLDSLNGIRDSSGRAETATALSAEATRGRDLFFEASRGFARCSTCHEVNGIGIPVTTPIASVPSDVQALRNLATTGVRTAVVESESMPALVISQGKRETVFYDLTSAPPVLRTQDPAKVRISDGTSWKHSSQMGAYTDAELSAILAYLKEVVRP